MSRKLFFVVVLAVVGSSGVALADCGGASLSEVTQAFDRAQSLERAGKQRAALDAYVRAQYSACEINPNELTAAQRAAALALPLAKAAEQQSDWRTAFEIYEAGGYYQLADKALVAVVQANPDEPHLFEQARSHFEQRALPAFDTNNALRLKVSGAYHINPQYVATVMAMPAKGVERALQSESNAFNEQYLREYVQLIAAQPELATDVGATQRALSAQQAFAQKWSAYPTDDPFRAAHNALNTLRQWGSVTRDPALARSVEHVVIERIEARISLLTQRYSGAPKLLEAAMDFAVLLNGDHATLQSTRAKIKAQAAKLGDAATAKNKFALAIGYYVIADDSAKAQAMRDRQQQIAMQNMQPSIEAMQQQAMQQLAQLKGLDPATVKALQAQMATQIAAQREELRGSQSAK